MDYELLKEKLTDFKTEYQDSLDMDKDTTFGIEIEFEDVYLYKIKKILKNYKSKWEYQLDISLDQSGAEVASPIYHDLKETYIDIKKMCTILKQMDANPYRNAAFQIHYGMEIFKDNPKNLEYFYKLWSIYENEIYRYSYGESYIPRSNIYKFARMCGSHINEVLTNQINLSYLGFNEHDNVTDSINDLSLIMLNNHSYGLSFRYEDYVSLIDPKTIEIRVMNGTIDEIMIQNYIKFYYKLLNYSSSDVFDKDFIDYKYKNIDYDKISINNSLKLNLENALELANLVLDNNYDKLCFLKQYLKDDTLIKKL